MSKTLHPNEVIVTDEMLIEAYETLGRAYIHALEEQYFRQTGRKPDATP